MEIIATALLFVALLVTPLISLTRDRRLIERAIFRGGVEPSEYEDCMAWAFGNEWKTMKVSDAAKVWNSRHRCLFELKGSDLLEESLERIGRAYANV